MKRYEPRLTPKSHQVIGIAELRARRLGNFDDPGMGKAKQAYDSIALLFQDREIDLAIVAMSSSLRGNFLNEVRSDTDQLIAKVVEGTKAERVAIYRYPGCHILILSYETVVRDITELKMLAGAFRTFIALDEAHKIKNHESQVSKACLELAPIAHKTTIFTGTPIPNRVKDVYPQLKFLGLDVGNDVNEFKERFPTLPELREFILKNSIRRKKSALSELSKIKKTLHRVKVSLSPEERKIYTDISDNLFSEFRGSFGKAKTIHISAVITKLLRLIQLTSNPELLGADLGEMPSKISALRSKVEDILTDDTEKVVIWTNFRKNVETLVKLLGEFKPVSLMGGMSREEVMKVTGTFQNDSTCKVLIAIPACAREGFTLTAARHAVYLDRNFSSLDWLQSQDRIHRIGQNREVHIHLIEAENTLDERIDEVLCKKEAIQAYLVGDQDTLEESPFIDLEQLRRLIA